jgi:hypothetical protein
VATKTDKEKDRRVSAEKGQALAKEHGMCFQETSALLGTNVQEAFV